jgi:hypothetical protein
MSTKDFVPLTCLVDFWPARDSFMTNLTGHCSSHLASSWRDRTANSSRHKRVNETSHEFRSFVSHLCSVVPVTEGEVNGGRAKQAKVKGLRSQGYAKLIAKDEEGEGEAESCDLWQYLPRKGEVRRASPMKSKTHEAKDGDGQLLPFQRQPRSKPAKTKRIKK